MNTQTLLKRALEGVDALGFELDRLGVTSRLNRHNLAAYVFNEQKRLEGEWDCLQARVDRRRAQIEGFARQVEQRAAPVVDPVLRRLGQGRRPA